MAVSEYHLDTRIRRRHIPLVTQQRRLRHLRSISARNITAHNQNICNEFEVAFTLHKKLDEPAFYTSEVILDGLNPSWKDFESSNFPENVDTASSYVVVKIWNMNSEKRLLIEWVVFFSGLVYLGEQIPKEGKNFKPDTLIFGMSEGYYGCNNSYQHTAGNTSDVTVKDTLEAEISGLRTSYTLSTLSRIKTVERAIKQTQAAVQRRRNSISNKLQSSQELHNIHAQQELLRIKISVLRTELQFQQKNSHSLEKEITLYKDDLLKKRNEINRKTEEQKKLVEKCFELSKGHNEYREMVLKAEAQLNFRRKELITELGCIYPIVEFPDHMGYSIHNVHLPNSENFSGHDDMMIAVALGYVCHIVLMIAQFLNVPLRYAINFYGSRSSITDHISSSLPDKTREFQLHLKHRDRRCFEYGVFLLNKNIAQLRILCRLSTRDLSATLPNLSSLIELRLSANSDSHTMTLHKEIKIPMISDKPTQNGFSASPQPPPSPNLIKTSESEMDLLKREMQAMIPTLKNDLQPSVKGMDSSTALSSSLDKGLNDMKILEETMELEPPKSSAQKLLKQTFHHSSYPNLNTSLRIAEGFIVDSVDAHHLATPPKVWTAESSRTNSEEEAIEEEVKPQRRPVVLNDSIFYIPSMQTDKENDNLHSERRQDEIVVNDDFSADLSLRTEQLASRKSSFQMQRLRSSADEEQLPQV